MIQSMTYQTRFDLKNRTGATKSGRKLTGFHFLSNTQFLATTADDRIRLFDLDVRMFNFRAWISNSGNIKDTRIVI